MEQTENFYTNDVYAQNLIGHFKKNFSKLFQMVITIP